MCQNVSPLHLSKSPRVIWSVPAWSLDSACFRRSVLFMLPSKWRFELCLWSTAAHYKSNWLYQKKKGFLWKKTAITFDSNTGNFCGLFIHNYPQLICKIAWLVAALRLPCFGVSWPLQEKSSECLCLDFFSMPSKTFLICMCFLKLSALFLK